MPEDPRYDAPAAALGRPSFKGAWDEKGRSQEERRSGREEEGSIDRDRTRVLKEKERQ